MSVVVTAFLGQSARKSMSGILGLVYWQTDISLAEDAGHEYTDITQPRNWHGHERAPSMRRMNLPARVQMLTRRQWLGWALLFGALAVDATVMVLARSLSPGIDLSTLRQRGIAFALQPLGTLGLLSLSARATHAGDAALVGADKRSLGSRTSGPGPERTGVVCLRTSASTCRGSIDLSAVHHLSWCRSSRGAGVDCADNSSPARVI